MWHWNYIHTSKNVHRHRSMVSEQYYDPQNLSEDIFILNIVLIIAMFNTFY